MKTAIPRPAPSDTAPQQDLSSFGRKAAGTLLRSVGAFASVAACFAAVSIVLYGARAVTPPSPAPQDGAVLGGPLGSGPLSAPPLGPRSTPAVDPGNTPAIRAELNAAGHLLAMGDSAAAGQFVADLVAQRPDDAAVQREAGLWSYRRWADARQRGRSRSAAPYLAAARARLVRAVRLNPQDRTANGVLGCVLVAGGDVALGRRFLTRAGVGPWATCGRGDRGGQ